MKLALNQCKFIFLSRKPADDQQVKDFQKRLYNISRDKYKIVIVDFGGFQPSTKNPMIDLKQHLGNKFNLILGYDWLCVRHYLPGSAQEWTSEHESKLTNNLPKSWQSVIEILQNEYHIT